MVFFADAAVGDHAFAEADFPFAEAVGFEDGFEFGFDLFGVEGVGGGWFLGNLFDDFFAVGDFGWGGRAVKFFG